MPVELSSTADGPAASRRATLAALLLFASLTFLLHFQIDDPYRFYCEDIENAFVPQTAYTYLHPWEAFAGKPTPSCNFGTSNYLTDGRPASLWPFWAALLSRVAPRDPRGLALFEWRVTSLYVLGSMAALYWFLRRAAIPGALAVAVACCYPFAYTVFQEWRHTDLMRGRLMIAPVLAALLLATRRGGYGAWLVLAGATVLCMTQAAQLYWVAALIAYWIAASAWIERRHLRELARAEGGRALRHAGPPLLALLIVVAALAPVYLRGQATMRESAFLHALETDPRHFLHYLADGRDWFSLSGLTTAERGFLPWSLAGLCLLGGLAIRQRFGGGAPLRWPGESRLLVQLGAPLLAGSLALSFVPDLPFDLFAIRDGSLEWRFGGVAAPSAFAVLFHTTLRTWLVLAEIGALLAGVGSLRAWQATPESPRDRRRAIAFAALVFALAATASTWISAEGWPGGAHARALAGVAAVLVAVAAVAHLAGRPRRLVQVAVIALGAGFAARAAVVRYEAGRVVCETGDSDALVQLRRDETLLARMPPEVSGQREHRLFGDKWCYFLDAPCALSYGLRTLPRDVLRFFEAAGAIDHMQLPYWMHLDYALLLESGIAQMLGVRWWILPADVMDSGILLTPEGDPRPLRLLEARGAFSKGWALESWETAESFEAAVARVMELGWAGELARSGVVQTPHEGPLEPSAPAPTAAGEAPTVELLGASPGELRFRVRSGSPTVLATNEFFHRDWRAETTDRSLPVVRVNAAFVGAQVPAGVHEVTIAR